MADFKLEIFTQEKKAFSAEVTAITLPGEDGYLGVLAHHAPLITVLGEGRLIVRQGTQISEFHLSGGFLEVHRNKATILTDRLVTGH
jgi:F-type H+-transporting ATPase subunit epsilon